MKTPFIPNTEGGFWSVSWSYSKVSLIVPLSYGHNFKADSINHACSTVNERGGETCSFLCRLLGQFVLRGHISCALGSGMQLGRACSSLPRSFQLQAGGLFAWSAIDFIILYNYSQNIFWFILAFEVEAMYSRKHHHCRTPCPLRDKLNF